MRGADPAPAPAGAPPVAAQGPSASAALPPADEGAGNEERRRELAQLRRRIGELRARWDATRRKKEDLKAALGEARLNLELRQAERREMELERVGVERDEKAAAAGVGASRVQVAALRADLAVRVRSLYRLGRLGYLRTLAAVESGRTFLRGLQVLSHQAKKDALLLARYEKSLAELGLRERELAARRGELAGLLVEERRREAELERARAAQAAALARATRTEEEERTAVGRLEEKATRLTALLDLLESKGRALPAGAASIHRFRGALDWPAKGPVAVPFGRVANPNFPKTFVKSSGLTLGAAAGTPVRAIFAGDVVHAQWLKGYGNLVVVDHGDGVFTLYGRLTTGTVPRGRRLALGDPVGTVAFPTDDEVPGLYFEIRDARISVDPRLWLR